MTGGGVENVASGPRLVRVAVPAPTRRLFTYEVPSPLAGAAVLGARVRVPFGPRRVTGVVVGDADRPQGVGLQPVLAVLDAEPALPRGVLELTRFASQHYLASWGATLRAALPSGLEVRARTRVRLTGAGAAEPAGRDGGALAFLRGRAEGLAEHTVRARLGARAFGRFLREGLVERLEQVGAPRGERLGVRVLEAAPGGAPASGPARERLLGLLREGGPLPAAEAMARARVSADVVRRAVASGLVRESRRPAANGGGEEDAAGLVEAPALADDQRAAVEAIAADLDAGRFAVHLLAGVTGSGKTEVYLRAAARALAAGGRVLMLVPEIGLAPHLFRSVRRRLGEVAAVLHSGLAEDRRLAEWRRVRRGEARVVLGTRSAVFAPLERLALVVVDEEHDPSYKQEESPRYHGRDLAIVRARGDGAAVVLGSATPSLESFERALEGRYRLSRMSRRVAGRPLPEVEFVDLREEFRATGSDAPLSRRLVALLEERRAGGEQAIVLINRRGYAPFVLCRECGETATCPSCDVNLTYHRAGERLRCHYCGHARPRGERCERCGSPHLHFGGEGTQRVERHLLRALPGVRVLRLDRDVVGRREGAGAILARFERGEADVLVGTQMVAKGHDFPRVTLVGVLAADAVLGLPDFRAAERTFQLVTQVAGRSGRGDRPGRVLVQAFRPDHPALRCAAAQDFEAFAERERRYRRALGYPPFVHLARVVVSDAGPERALDRAREAAGILRRAGGGRLSLLGPAPAPLARLRGRYRVHLLVRAQARGRLVVALETMLEALFPGGASPRGLTVDVDPVSLQ